MNNTTTFLTEQEIRQQAPSVFAESPSESVSSKYTFIPTYEILDWYGKQGWYPVKVQQEKTRKGNPEHAKHIVRLRHAEYSLQVGDVFPEIVQIGSHNRTHGAVMDAGLFRLACSNGLTVSTGFGFDEGIRQKHMGITYQEFLEMLKERIKRFDSVTREIERFQDIEMTALDKNTFAMKARDLRWGKDSVIDYSELLKSRRVEDEKDDLWTTFNKIQENVIKGGIKYQLVDHEGKDRKGTTKPINNIYNNQKINKELWNMMVAIYNSKVNR